MNSSVLIRQMAVSSEDSKGEMGSEWSSWNNYNIGQILLPILCAAFIATVIIVIACCLIKKKSKPLRGWRERSCHTIETSHDMNENGIYDVIDKVKVSTKSKTSDKIRHHDKLNSNCILVAQNEINGNKNGGIFSTGLPAVPPISGPQLDSLLVPPLPPCTKHDWSKFERTFEVKHNEIPSGHENRTSVSKTEEEGVYETLDRYWTQSNTFKKELSSQLTELSQDGSLRNTKSGDKNSERSLNMSQNTPAEPSVLPNFEKATNDKIICQLTLFHISESDESSRQAESVYYYVNLQSLANDQEGNLPSVLQNARLQVVPGKAVDLKKDLGSNITLEPVEGALMPKINESSLNYSLHETPHKRKLSCSRSCGKDYEAPQKLTSKRTPILLAKKSESFRDANSELQAVKDNYLNHRRQSDSSNGRTPRTSTSSCSENATDKILKKLGPLPPVPSSRTSLSRTESDITGNASHVARVASANTHQRQTNDASNKNTCRPLPLSPDQEGAHSSNKNKRLERSLSEMAPKRTEPEKYTVSNAPTLSSFQKDASKNNSRNDSAQNDAAITDEPIYSHYFVLESSDYSSGTEDNLDEKYLE
ncbi:hypothetical protein BgiBS90_017282 [Biomphalaria glabrata]|nr:hypothetical protein BgiBS90_017282 [Biomphalaria glabrata]